VLANFDEAFPHWKGRGYEIAGFGWWQGHKDGGEQGTGVAGLAATRYERNLVRLIASLRKEFDAPDAPFVVATVGFGGGITWEPGSSADTIFKAQMNVGDPAKPGLPLQRQCRNLHARRRSDGQGDGQAARG
jgi:alpha-galactosidase